MLNGEGAAIINDANCGFSVNAGDYEGLAKIILDMYEMSMEDRMDLGSNGFKFYENNFTLKKCIDNLEFILKK
jgi:glycosyltransferase involved in cell wall biosynthesis